MDRRLLDYLPPVLREVMEMRAVNGANEPEIAAAWDALARLLDNQFLDSADRNGVKVWERELNIRAKDTDTLETRKTRIKAKWNTGLPYTAQWLSQWLTGICGEDRHREALSDYTLRVSIDCGEFPDPGTKLAEIMAALRQVMPGNLLLEVVGAVRTAPTANTPGHLRFHRFGVSASFCSERRPVLRFDGKADFGGSFLFCQSPAGIGCTLVTRGPSRLDGSFRLDGSVRLDGSSVEEESQHGN